MLAYVRDAYGPIAGPAAGSAGISAAASAGMSAAGAADERAGGGVDGRTGGAADGRAADSADGTAGSREYRIGELARAAGITARTLRYYQERKLLPPPRREGRIAWYSQAHLSRLRVIGQLLDRGHTLGGTGELLSAWEQGFDLAELLGFERAMTAPWSDEVPVPVTVDTISGLLGGQVTAEELDEAVRLGYIEVLGGRVAYVSRRLLDITTILVREGIPLRAILDAGRELQISLDRLASLFVELVTSHVVDRTGGPPPPREVARLTETVERLRPVARIVIDAEFARAMDRRARATYSEFIRLLAAADHPSGAGDSAASGASELLGAQGTEPAKE
jgi:DNA-binding transcriptional MerR regulator